MPESTRSNTIIDEYLRDLNSEPDNVRQEFVFAPVALFCGATALAQIRDSHERGRRRAIVATVVGGIGTLVAMFTFVAATGVFSSPPQCAYIHLPPAPSGVQGRQGTHGPQQPSRFVVEIRLT